VLYCASLCDDSGPGLNGENHNNNNNKDNSKVNDKSKKSSSSTKTKLNPTQAKDLAEKLARDGFKDQKIDIYLKSNGVFKSHGEYFWDFSIHNAKTGKIIDGIQIEDKTGRATLI